MSSDLAFSKNRRPGQLLHRFLETGYPLFVREPARLLEPLIGFMEDFHLTGQAHGAVMPGRLLLSPSGEWDLDFFKTRAGSPDALELEIYYPDGPGQSLEERRRRDVRALAAVMHLIVTDHPPARRGRRVQTLAEHPHAQAWPSDFITLIDRVLTSGPDEALPPLGDWRASLGVSAAEASPAETSPRAEETVSAREEENIDGPAPPTAPPATIEKPETAYPPELSGNHAPPAPVWPLRPPVRLPNAMVGRAFATGVDTLDGGVFPEEGHIELLGDLPPGLAFSGGMLSGSPTQAGEFEIRLRRHPVPSVIGVACGCDHLLTLTVNANPQSLWKNLPSDPDGIFARPDTDAGCLTEGPLTVIGASRRGRSHAHTGGYRDDDFSMAWFPGNSWYVLTVADGAGSARFSREGSHVACGVMRAFFGDELGGLPGNSLTELVRQQALHPDEAGNEALLAELQWLFGTAARRARAALETAAEETAAELRDFHTTLITVLLYPLADGRWFAAVFSIGDGAAAVVGASGGSPCLLTRADSGDYAGQTVFLTMPEVLSSEDTVRDRIRTAVLEEFEALLLVTDGISDPRFPSDTALADPAGWSALWQEVQPLLAGKNSPQAAAEELLDWMGFHSPGHHDDRTVVLAAPTFFPITK